MYPLPGLTAPESASPARAKILLDDFEKIDGWSAVTSPTARLEIAQDAGRTGAGHALRLDFEFQDGSGWVIARKAFPMRLPNNFSFHFFLRGDTPPVDTEFKLVDSRENVWWSRQRGQTLTQEWQPVKIKRRQISHAWGPGGGLEEITVIELAFALGQPGKGSVWIDELRFEEREPTHAYTLNPTVSASTSTPDQPPEAVLNAEATRHWRSGALSEEQWLLLDFLTVREYGGLVIDWDPQDYAVDYAVQASDDGETWQDLYQVRNGNGQRDYLYLPDAESRYLRLNLQRSSREQGYAMRRLQVQSYEFSTSPSQFFNQIARDAPRGYYPRYFQDEQSYWTLVGVSGGGGQSALLSQDGILEVDKGGFTLEPFLFTEGRLLSWADVDTHQELVKGYLPIPSVVWQHPDYRLTITAFATDAADQAGLYARYRLENHSANPRHVTLYLAVRPFQVNPPWQALNMTGGVSPIYHLRYAHRVLHIQQSTAHPLPPPKSIRVLTAPNRFQAATFDQGPITDYLALGQLPETTEADDAFGYASGALEYDWDLPPGTTREVVLHLPFAPAAPRPKPGRSSVTDRPTVTVSPAPSDVEAAETVARRLQQVTQDWEARLDRVDLDLPLIAQRLVWSLKSNLAYILINRNGPAIRPGSRAYARSWIRDGALTSAALLSMGHTQEARDFLQWYARYQRDDGAIPCCVDGRGADLVPEHDSHGEFIFAIMEYYRYTRDIGFLRHMWPAVVKTVDYIESLRRQRLTEPYQTQPNYQAYFGLVPESISHEGYASQPRHSYWDNFFILRGLKDAATLATILDEDTEATRFATLRDAFRKDLYASIRAAMQQHAIDFIPGAVELGDFDATSTTIAVDPGGELGRLPQPALDRTFARYDDFFQKRLAEAQWDAYTPYEWRVVGTLVRLGLRERAQALMAFFMEGQRPPAWNHWAEVVWRDPKLPRFIGDMPHTWVGSDFIRATRSLFAYEREADQALVIGAGIPAVWLEQAAASGIAIRRLPTWYGTLNYRMVLADANTVRVRLTGDVTVPAGRIILHSPLTRPLRAVRLNGRELETFTDRYATLNQFPAEVELHYAPASTVYATAVDAATVDAATVDASTTPTADVKAPPNAAGTPSP